MLVTFSSPESASFTMFGDVAKRLIKMMGHSGKVPGAIGADGVPDALQRLKSRLAELEQADEEDTPNEKQSDEAVGLSRRAIPLLEMLENAAAADDEIMWRSGS